MWGLAVYGNAQNSTVGRAGCLILRLRVTVYATYKTATKEFGMTEARRVRHMKVR